MPDMREEFEAWATKHRMPIHRDGVVTDYAARCTDECWQAWKASRAALRVELPEVGSAPDGAKYDLGFGDPKFAHDYREHQVSAAMRQLCREALQRAGIEVK
ncbi:hypothetical protein KUC42_08455 [Pseudomonas aeruginosa]|nr:hypothetical protein [Pseudomonas aeruginosa]MCV0108804.1 hypothetical protein [Pseudomonas aeruginosa]MCV0113068.1 hypothetical protein [Pseudomonas aeruginosa]